MLRGLAILAEEEIAGHSSVVRPFQGGNFKLNQRNEDEVSAG
jgi:hypothetical protein